MDVHRGGAYWPDGDSVYLQVYEDTYQFAYFLRETEPYSVLLKVRATQEVPRNLIVYSQRRNFVLATEPPVTTSSRPAEKQESSTRKKRRKTRGGTATEEDDKDEDDYHPSDSGPIDSDDPQVDDDGEIEMVQDLNTSTTKGTRGATESTARVHVKEEEDEEDIPQTEPLSTTEESSHAEDTGISIEVDDDDEPKPKLALELKYRAFSNFNRCLCVVVEPWPPQSSYSRGPSLVPTPASREPSVAPTISRFSTNHGQRAKTPLFLPDVDDEPTTPGHSRFRTLPPVPLFDAPPKSRDTDDMEEWDNSTSLMQFSQMLSATGRTGGADAEEEDEFDGMALFADAEEARES